MPHAFTRLACIALALAVPASWTSAQDADDPPLSATDRERLLNEFRQVLKSSPAPDDQQPGAVGIHSRRGDACLFLGQFQDAVAEYKAMVALNPDLDASHWRLGIALYFADQPEQAAQQFDKYHSFDDVDRENGIWRFLCHYRAFGAEQAARELLRYDKDDRQPFPVVYRLFDGGVTPEEARQQIPPTLPRIEREKRVFYTELYIGLLKTVQNDPASARIALRRATACRWPRSAGFGPHYMWHVGRLQYERLSQDERTSPESAGPAAND